ncbi:MAG: hypothetical protein ACREKS_00470 [Candidatus Rokuibacteriota bacterium]
MNEPPSNKYSVDDASPLWSTLPFALPLLCGLFVLPFLGWQRAILRAYADALKDPQWSERWNEDARDRAKLLWDAYGKFEKSQHEYGKDWRDWQSDLIRGYLETVDGVLKSLGPRPSR